MDRSADPKPANTTKQRMAEMLRLDPLVSANDLAAALGISRQRVYQLLPAFELPPGVIRRRPLPGAPKTSDLRLRQNRGPRLSPLAAGTINEMVVAIDLISREIDVFRSVAVIAKFDMIARCRKNGRLLAMEVKTARRGKKGYLSYPRRRDGIAEGEHYALVFGTGEVLYIPPLPTDFGCAPKLQRGA